MHMGAHLLLLLLLLLAVTVYASECGFACYIAGGVEVACALHAGMLLLLGLYICLRLTH
jgi:hypothetical protein